VRETDPPDSCSQSKLILEFLQRAAMVSPQRFQRSTLMSCSSLLTLTLPSLSSTKVSLTRTHSLGAASCPAHACQGQMRSPPTGESVVVTFQGRVFALQAARPPLCVQVLPIRPASVLLAPCLAFHMTAPRVNKSRADISSGTFDYKPKKRGPPNLCVLKAEQSKISRPKL
jgi:hypothetical protein